MKQETENLFQFVAEYNRKRMPKCRFLLVAAFCLGLFQTQTNATPAAPTGLTVAWASFHQVALACAVPALSAAAGREVIPSNNTRCVNLLGCKRNTLTLPWEHSAMKDLAYFYVFRFYERAKDIIHNTSQSPASAGGN